MCFFSSFDVIIKLTGLCFKSRKFWNLNLQLKLFYMYGIMFSTLISTEVIVNPGHGIGFGIGLEIAFGLGFGME